MSEIPNNTSSFFDRIAGHAIAGIIFLTPFFFLPFFGVSTYSAKFFLVYVLTAIASVAFIFARSRDGVVALPKRRVLILTLLLPLTFLASSIATGRFSDSFFGYGFEPTTTLFISMMAVLTILLSVYGRSEKTLSQIVRLAVASFAVVSGYQLIRLLATLVYKDPNTNVLSFGNFVGTYGNLLGKWNDIAIVSALMMMATIISWRSLDTHKKYVAGAIFIVSGFLMKVVAFSLIWPLLAVFLMVYAVQDSVSEGKITLFRGGRQNNYRIGVFVLGILLIMFSALQSFSVTLNSKGQIMHPRVFKLAYLAPNMFGGVPAEYRPGTASAITVYKNVLKHQPVFGQGPNRFVESWMMYRPVEINQTVSADADFAYSFSYIITLMTTVGLLGSIAIVLFLLYAIRQSVKVAFSNNYSSTEKVVAYGTLFLICTSILYVPAPALIVYMFLGIGIVFSKPDTATIVTIKKKKILALLAGILALIVLFLSYVLIQEYRASRYFALATNAVNIDKNISSAETYLTKAMKVYPTDLYYRSMSELSSLKANVIVSQTTNKDGQISEEGRKAAIESYATSELYAEKAISANPKNYVNYLFAARVYEGDPEKLGTAEDLYNKTLLYSPNNPNVFLGLAKVKAQKGDIEGVKLNLQKSLQIRPMFTDALIAGAQVKASEKDVQGTLDFLVQAYKSKPSSVDLLLTIAQIQYAQQNDIKGATQTLEYTVGTNPTYADARLALANLYAKQSNFIDAANLLVGIKTNDQATQAVLDKYIADLKAGKNPFGGVVTPTKTATSSATSTTKATTTKK